MQRWIVHVDMDAFFAAVEQRDNPALRGQPVIIGGSSRRGVVSAASYEARRYGVHSAMPIAEAQRRCPHGVFLPANHRKYSRVSQEIHAIFSDFTPLIEPLSLDEAFLDVTGMDWLYDQPLTIAKTIKKRIHDELELTASAGVAPNKFLAKLASDLEKPNGLVIIHPGEEASVLEHLPITRLWGVGEKTADVLRGLKINTIGQLARTDLRMLEKNLGKWAIDAQRLALGLDDRPVVPDIEPKSIGNEITFDTDLISREEIETHFLALAEQVGRRLRYSNYQGRTITLKIRFIPFDTITRSQTLATPTNLGEVLYETACQVLHRTELLNPIRLLGLTVSHLAPDSGGQLSLFSETDNKRRAVTQAVDRLRDKYGESIVTRVRLIKDRETGIGKREPGN
jgi:DNA polymerase IV